MGLMKNYNEKRNNEIQGRVLSWVINELNLSGNELAVFVVILINTIGKGNQYAYIKQEELTKYMTKDTLVKHRRSLVEKGLISFNVTKGYTKYQILQPKNEIENFMLEDCLDGEL